MVGGQLHRDTYQSETDVRQSGAGCAQETRGPAWKVFADGQAPRSGDASLVRVVIDGEALVDQVGAWRGWEQAATIPRDEPLCNRGT